MNNLDPVGDPFSEFERGDGKGPFECGNCVHMDRKQGVCEHPIVNAAWKGEKKGGRAPVDHDDCCRYVRRPGR